MKVDLRTSEFKRKRTVSAAYGSIAFALVTFDVPPQEILTRDSVVRDEIRFAASNFLVPVDCVGRCRGLFSNLQSHHQCDERGKCSIFNAAAGCHHAA